jgi:hypothetical protein
VTVTVPQGYVYVVKQLTFYSDPLVQPARGWFRDLLSGAALFSAGTAAGAPGWFGFYGALTFTEGASFRWEASVGLGDGVDVYAGGYVLTSGPVP